MVYQICAKVKKIEYLCTLQTFFIFVNNKIKFLIRKIKKFSDKGMILKVFGFFCFT